MRKFAFNRSGATAIEYGLILALIAIAITSSALMFGSSLAQVFSTISGTLASPSA